MPQHCYRLKCNVTIAFDDHYVDETVNETTFFIGMAMTNMLVREQCITNYTNNLSLCQNVLHFIEIHSEMFTFCTSNYSHLQLWDIITEPCLTNGGSEYVSNCMALLMRITLLLTWTEVNIAMNKIDI